MIKILVVDDEKAQRDALAGFLKKLGYEVHTEDSAQTALAHMHTHPIDIVLSDYKMPYMTGADLLKEVKSRHPATILVLITAYGTIETAVEAMKSGAWDFLSKPVDLDQLEALLAGIVQHLKHLEKAQGSPAKPPEATETGFIAEDNSMQELMDQAKRIASSQATILITGETGVGKEVLADFIHRRSGLAKQQMVAVNCAALPSHLIESELFGHEKGSFTGATAARTGRFEEADGGTLFLDEIGDLPLNMQTKLLRFLQNGEFQRIGDNTIRRSKVRILAATNVDLEHAVKIGEFREDLFYRLNVIQLHIPPLRERPRDIESLASYFIKKYTERENRPMMAMSADAVRYIREHPFPGNVRELGNMIERAVLLSQGAELTVEDLGGSVSRPMAMDAGKLKSSVAHLEGELILKALKEAGGNQSECARRLGISERVLRYKLQKYNLS